MASFIFFSLWPVGFGTFVSNNFATKPHEQSFCEVFCVIKVGIGNVLTVSKVFLEKYGSSSLEEKHFLKESTNYFSLLQLMPLCQRFNQVKTSGHLFYVEEILVSVM